MSTAKRQPNPALTISRKGFDAVLFDLDGVVTKTAKVHAAAWKTLFDNYLERLSRRVQIPFEPFDADGDYKQYVDGKPRYEGVRSFLESRGIHLEWGDEDDPPGVETICGLGNRKNEILRERLETDGVEVFGPSVRLIRDLRKKGFQTAVVSSSKNCGAVLEASGLTDVFDVRVDGITASEAGLAGKPDPATFLEAARRLAVKPERALVVEDAAAGVEAGRRGEFGLVVGISESGDRETLARHGADIVLKNLGDVVVE